ncbi:MAG: pyridoxal phosphate-dependent aminotransferase [Phycisphaerales bacterium]|nr:pyridoxal phosphate-dependent aminotransferase [Phycisphaerales bacterium]
MPKHIYGHNAGFLAGPRSNAIGYSKEMDLSNRVKSIPSSVTLQVTARIRELKAEGKDVIGFGAGEPNFTTPEVISQAAIASLQAGVTGYQPVPGTNPAREAIAEKLRSENGINCQASDIVISAGGKHSIYLVCQALLDMGRGQEVVLPTPAWVGYRPSIELSGGTVVEVPGSTENDFKITPQQLDEAITENTTMVIFNTPSNPCGTAYTPDEIRALAEVLASHPKPLILSDEIYEKLLYGGFDHLSFGSIPEIADRVITINGLSKSFAMTGWRIGYTCAPGTVGGEKGGLAKAMTRLQSQMNTCITSFTYAAVEAAMRDADADVAMMREAFAERAQVIYEQICQWPEVQCPKPTGAFYAFPDISAYFGRVSPAGKPIESAVDFASALLEETLVAVVPGEDFGEIARGHVRLSFATTLEQIVEGCQRVEQWLSKIPSQKAIGSA